MTSALVALAILLRSSFLHLRAAMAPVSTKYLRQRLSMPPVVRTTLAPAPRIFYTYSLVMSYSLWGRAKRGGEVWEGRAKDYSTQ